jgi:hypothetical protein
MLLLALTLPLGLIAADLGTDAYHLPLVDPYAIQRSDKAFPVSAEHGLYQLVRPGVGLSMRTLVPKVESVAVRDGIIFGTSADGFFILDARQPKQKPQVVKVRDAWETALSRFGITDSSVTEAPDVLAAGLSEHVLRPWNYRVMGNRFGISDSAWSGFGQLGAMGLAFIVGRFFMRSRPAILLVSALGAIGAMVAHIMVDGQGAFVLLVFMPIIYALAVRGRRDLRESERPGARA